MSGLAAPSELRALLLNVGGSAIAATGATQVCLLVRGTLTALPGWRMPADLIMGGLTCRKSLLTATSLHAWAVKEKRGTS